MTPHHTRRHDEPSTAWTIIIPVKDTALAKTRLTPFSQPHRARLALAFVLDAATAAMDCADVRRVVAVTNDVAAGRALRLAGVEVLADEPAGGLNAAIRHGCARVRDEDPGTAVAAMCGDLPTLQPIDLSSAFTLAAGMPRWFVADAAGLGTTLLAAAPHTPMEPAFGPASRTRHQALGIPDLTAEDTVGLLARLRRDVDTLADLADARLLGVGLHTRAALTSMDAA